MFNFFSKTTNRATDAGDALYTKDELLGAYRDLTYQECQNLFRLWPLGKRLVEALPNFAMSTPRTFSFGEFTTNELITQFKKSLNELKVESVVKTTAMNARIYGMAAIFVPTKHSHVKQDAPITRESISSISFTSLDPLSMGAHIQVDLDPLSSTFQQPLHITIQGREVNPTRIQVVYNDIPLYLKFNPSSFSFSGSSVFQNTTLLIRTFNRTMLALQRAATKAGSIVRTTKEVSHSNGINFTALAKNNEMIRAMENDGIAAIGSGEQVQLFDINNIAQVGDIITKINEMFMMALNDTPSGILLDRNLSAGLNDGTEDMKAILIAVEHFREQILTPLYNFTDKYTISHAFNEDFLKEYLENNPSLHYTPSEFLEALYQNYSFEFGNIYPSTELEKADKKLKVIDSVLKLKELGVGNSDLEAILNDSGELPIQIKINNKEDK